MSGMSNFRITTNGLYRNYRNNLYKNNKSLTDAMTTVQTSRKFNTYAEDPAEASKAWRLRRSYWRTGDQIDNTNFAISKYESAYTAMGAIVDGDSGNGQYGLNGVLEAIRANTDTAGAGRSTLGMELIETAKNIVSVMNTKYGDDFVFAGADGENIPFEWKTGTDGKARLYYRDVNVAIEKPADFADFKLDVAQPEYGNQSFLDHYKLTSVALGDAYDSTKTDLESAYLDKPLTAEEYLASNPGGNYANYKAQYVADYKAKLSAQNATPSSTKVLIELDNAASGSDDDIFDEAQKVYDKLSPFWNYAEEYGKRNGVIYREGFEQYQKLQDMADEATYLDIGIGMKESARGEIVTGSAFNTSISGLNFLGFGRDQNLAVIVRELGEIYAAADPDTGAFANGETDQQRADELINKLHDAVGYSQGQHTKLDADAKYLRTNLAQLETNKAELDQQICNAEDMDMAEAITQMTWAQYCYNAALRIGTNILSQSLIDYMS